jgi:hypothetical protein
MARKTSETPGGVARSYVEDVSRSLTQPGGCQRKPQPKRFSGGLLSARRGCLALASFPLLAVAAPAVALLRRAALRRRGDALLVGVRRTTLGEVTSLRCELDIPLGRLAEVSAAVSGLVAEGASLLGRTVGCIGIVPGEEPVLVALGPRRDTVAARVRTSLASGDAHRRPELWLALPPGVYLGEVVDPYAPFSGDESAIVRLLHDRGVCHALLTEVVAGAASARIVLTLYAARPELRKFLTLARSSLADLPGWAPAR